MENNELFNQIMGMLGFFSGVAGFIGMIIWWFFFLKKEDRKKFETIDILLGIIGIPIIACFAGLVILPILAVYGPFYLLIKLIRR